MGGGSSNAATTLWALNKLLGNRFTLADLIKWSAEIGSDVSFFLSQGTAYCTGRGEIIYPLPSLKCQPLWIVKPNQGTSTPAVYKRLDVSKLIARDPEKTVRNFYKNKPDYFNDLEQPAMEELPELAEIKHKLLQAGFKTVLLSGSGSSFFCLGPYTPPPLPNCRIFDAKWIQRSAKTWYGEEI